MRHSSTTRRILIQALFRRRIRKAQKQTLSRCLAELAKLREDTCRTFAAFNQCNDESFEAMAQQCNMTEETVNMLALHVIKPAEEKANVFEMVRDGFYGRG